MMAPMAIPGVASTPPSSRSSTPNARPSLKQYANTVLPFTRQSGSGKFAPLPCPDEVSSSCKEDRQPTLPQMAREGSSVSDAVGSWVSTKRLPPRAVSSFTVAAPFQRCQGFLAPSGEAGEVQSGAGGGVGAPKGLLSRQLSSECLAPRPQFPEPVLGSRDDTIRKLNQTFQAPSAFESSDYDDESALGGEVLEQMQEGYSVFKDPTVVQAFKVAWTARTAVQVPMNAPSNFGHWDSDEQRTVLGNCCNVAAVLAELGADETVIASALLHNVLQCSMMTEARLREFLPLEVTSIVSNVARMSGICEVRREVLDSRGKSKDPKFAQEFTSLLLAMADVRAVLVKLADRLHNLRTAPPGPSREAAAHEALDIFAPLANRLGVWSIKAEMEDLAFQVLYPKEHDELKAKLRESQARGSLEKALDTLKGVLDKQGTSIVDLSGRPKNLYGVFKKMKDKQRNVNDVLDVRALRVIVRSKTDCYEVLRQVHGLWKPLPDRLKDYIRRPKENGYQSLHTVVMGEDGVPMEVQIRTDKMHFIAEYGVAAHWRYKESVPSDEHNDQQVAWARWLITWKLEIEDKKCRPSGSPGNDSSLAHLASQVCKFPEHGPDCKFAAFLRSWQIAPSDASKENYPDVPAQVIILDRTSSEKDAPLRIQQVGQRTTAQELLQQLKAAMPFSDDVALLVNNDHPVSNQLLRSGDQVEIVGISKYDQLPDKAASSDQTGSSLYFDRTPDGRRSNLVRRVGRPPRPSSEIVRSHDAIGRAEVEAKRVELIRAFQQPSHEDVAMVGAGGDLMQEYRLPLIYSYGFVEGQPELN